MSNTADEHRLTYVSIGSEDASFGETIWPADGSSELLFAGAQTGGVVEIPLDYGAATIISGGRSRRMIELAYDGYRRLVEPYKLEYYVRKRDGVGNEYFWGYDTSGGKSGTLSIKHFLCDKIDDVLLTNQNFVPRYEIEL